MTVNVLVCWILSWMRSCHSYEWKTMDLEVKDDVNRILRVSGWLDTHENSLTPVDFIKWLWDGFNNISVNLQGCTCLYV